MKVKELPKSAIDRIDNIFKKGVTINGFLHCWGNYDLLTAKNFWELQADNKNPDGQKIWAILKEYPDK